MRPLFLFASSFPFSIFFLSLDFASNPWKCSTQKSMQGKTRHKNKSNAVMLMLNAPSVDGNQREEKRRSGEKQKKEIVPRAFFSISISQMVRGREKRKNSTAYAVIREIGENHGKRYARWSERLTKKWTRTHKWQNILRLVRILVALTQKRTFGQCPVYRSRRNSSENIFSPIFVSVFLFIFFFFFHFSYIVVFCCLNS